MSNHYKALLLTCALVTGLGVLVTKAKPLYEAMLFFAIMAFISTEIYDFIKSKLDQYERKQD